MKPKSLEIHNFLSHTHSKIDFDKFNVALLLGSFKDSVDESNGSGKSAVLEAIRWALFDKARHKKKDGVVKRGEVRAKVIYQFESGNILYRVMRQFDKVANETEVVLEQWNGGDFEVIDCDTNTATNNKIVSVINFNHDVFINSVYFKQGDISLFTDSTPGKRKDILKSILKLDKWDAYQKNAKKTYNSLSAELKEKQKRYVSLDEIDGQITVHSDNISELKREISRGNKNFAALNAELVQKKTDFGQISDSAAGKEQLASLKRDFADAKKRLRQVERKITDNDDTVAKNSSAIQKHTEKLILAKDTISSKAGIDIAKKRAGLLGGRTQEKMLKEQVLSLKQDIKLDSECSSCLRPVTSQEAVKIKELRQVRLEELQGRHQVLAKKIKAADVKLRSLEAIVVAGDRAEIEKSKLELGLKSLQSELDRAIEDNVQYRKDERKIRSVDYAPKIVELTAKFADDNVAKLEADISKLESSLPKAKRAIDRLNVDYGSKVSSRDSLKASRAEQETLHTDIDAIKGQVVIYDKLRHCFGKDGIQAIIIENVVEELEVYTNETLQQICNEPTSIAIHMQKQSDSGSWSETFDIEVKSGTATDELDAFSGGEKFRISLALRLALSKVLSKRMGGSIQFLLLDEVSSSLDAKGLNMFADIVKRLGEEMKILIITHDDRLKDKFDDILMVEKTESGSRVEN